MGELYAGGIVLGFFASIGAILLVGYNVGKIDGEFEIRNQVVLYCIENLQLCKEEYNIIKTQENLNNYKQPELGETK